MTINLSTLLVVRKHKRLHVKTIYQHEAGQASWRINTLQTSLTQWLLGVSAPIPQLPHTLGRIILRQVCAPILSASHVIELRSLTRIAGSVAHMQAAHMLTFHPLLVLLAYQIMKFHLNLCLRVCFLENPN